MRLRGCSITILVALTVILQWEAAFGVEADRSKPAASAQGADPQLLFDLVDADQKITIAGHVRLNLTVVNGQAATAIRDVKLLYPASLFLCLGRGEQCVADQATIAIPPERVDLRSPGERLDLGPIELDSIVGVPGYSWTPLAILSFLTRRTGKEKLTARLEYAPDLAEAPSRVLTKELTATVEPNPLSLFVGAMLGALLGATFVALMGFESAFSKVEPQNRRFGDVVVLTGKLFTRLLFRFVKGCVAASIVILLLQSASGVSLPIQVSVNDFFGALVLALAGDRVASKVYAWVTGP